MSAGRVLVVAALEASIVMGGLDDITVDGSGDQAV